MTLRVQILESLTELSHSNMDMDYASPVII